MKKDIHVALALAAAICTPCIAWASDAGGKQEASGNTPSSTIAAPTLSMDPADAAPAKNAPPTKNAAATDVLSDPPALTLDSASAPSRFHGFGALSINTQYITPRGLVANDSSPQFQGVLGLIMDVYHGDGGAIDGVSLDAGTWGDFTPHPNPDIWVEQDFWVGFDVKFLKKWDFSYTLDVWTFPDVSTKPENDPSTEYNMEFKFSYDDSDLLKAFAVHPYVNVFWNFAGPSSPVVAQALLGKNDNTAYVEIGGAPSYTWKCSADYPITFSMPTYVSVGDSSFWGETPSGQRSNLGVVSTGLKMSVPLNFVPADFGHWNAYVGVQWIYTANPALNYINEFVMGAGDAYNRVLGTAGFGFSF
jgi:hypothetical protein